MTYIKTASSPDPLHSALVFAVHLHRAAQLILTNKKQVMTSFMAKLHAAAHFSPSNSRVFPVAAAQSPPYRFFALTKSPRPSGPATWPPFLRLSRYAPAGPLHLLEGAFSVPTCLSCIFIQMPVHSGLQILSSGLSPAFPKPLTPWNFFTFHLWNTIESAY